MSKKEVEDILIKARTVLESNTHWADSLKLTIISYHKGLEAERERIKDRFKVLAGGKS